MSPRTPRAMSPFGVGPLIGGMTAAWFAMMLLVQWLVWPKLAMTWLPGWAAQALGGGLIVAGAWLYIPTARRILPATREGRLMTDGPFAYVRHPLYAIGIFLLTPGVCLLFRSWLVMTTPVAMFITFALLIHREERVLRERFGRAYDAYAQRTGRLLPHIGPKR